MRAVHQSMCTYDHEIWVVTEKIRSCIQAAEMSFFRGGVDGLSLRDEVRSSTIWRELGLEHQKESAEVVQVSDHDASCRGFTGTFNWEETTEHTEGIAYRLWPWKTLGSTGRSWRAS